MPSSLSGRNNEKKTSDDLQESKTQALTYLMFSPAELVTLVALLMPKGTTGGNEDRTKGWRRGDASPHFVLHGRFSGDAPQNQGHFVQQDAAPSVADHGADQFADLRFSINP